MTIAAGTRLGPFEIVALIGAGGMGEVGRAKDTRLDRTEPIREGLTLARAQCGASPHRSSRSEAGQHRATKSGAELLDFGLTSRSASQTDIGESLLAATHQKPLTAEGTILKTFQYMAAGAARRCSRGRSDERLRARRGLYAGRVARGCQRAVTFVSNWLAAAK